VCERTIELPQDSERKRFVRRKLWKKGRYGALVQYYLQALSGVVKRRKQNRKISFHFFAAPLHPRLLNGLVRKFLVLYAIGRSARRAEISVTILSERKIKFRITTRSARTKLIKILRILFIHCSNFVQETPH